MVKELVQAGVVVERALARLQTLREEKPSMPPPNESEYRRFLERLPDALRWAGVPEWHIEQAIPLPAWAAPHVESRRGLYLFGSAGVGKTTVAGGILREAVVSRARVVLAEKRDGFWSSFNSHAVRRRFRFVSWPEFSMQLQDAWRSEESALDLLKDVATVDLLVLDDVGAEKPTEFVRQSLYYVLNKREGMILKTIATGNHAPSRLDDLFDERVSSRIAGLGAVKEVTGKDRRLQR